MSTYIERLQIEREDLDKKIDLLNNFIYSNTSVFNDLLFVDQELMIFQLEYMGSYSDVLSKRIKRASPEVQKSGLTI